MPWHARKTNRLCRLRWDHRAKSVVPDLLGQLDLKACLERKERRVTKASQVSVS
jgi:hypothetical protein